MGYYSYVRPDYIGQKLYLSESVHAHLQHGDFSIRLEFQNGEGETESAVVVLLVSSRLVFCSSNVVNHVSGTGLAYAAGDSNLLF